jgi:hypothetical protein
MVAMVKDPSSWFGAMIWVRLIRVHSTFAKTRWLKQTQVFLIVGYLGHSLLHSDMVSISNDIAAKLDFIDAEWTRRNPLDPHLSRWLMERAVPRSSSFEHRQTSKLHRYCRELHNRQLQNDENQCNTCVTLNITRERNQRHLQDE